MWGYADDLDQVDLFTLLLVLYSIIWDDHSVNDVATNYVLKVASQNRMSVCSDWNSVNLIYRGSQIIVVNVFVIIK